MLPSSLRYGGRDVLLKYHKFNSGLRELPANSLAALERILAGDVAVLEFDIGLLGDGNFAVLHDARLERETTGVGALANIDRATLKQLRLRDSDEPPATLEDVVERLLSHQQPLKVQVDLKEVLPLADEAAAALVEALDRLRSNPKLRVVVGCLADWNLRQLRRLDQELLVGFDPAFYLHAPTQELSLPLPTRVNAYNYLDDHPLGYRRLQPVSNYLVDRLDSLLNQVRAAEVYLHKAFIVQALQDGFNPVEFCHVHSSCLVDAWTLNSGDPGFDDDLASVLHAGVDQITTDTPLALAARGEQV